MATIWLWATTNARKSHLILLGPPVFRAAIPSAQPAWSVSSAPLHLLLLLLPPATAVARQIRPSLAKKASRIIRHLVSHHRPRPARLITPPGHLQPDFRLVVRLIVLILSQPNLRITILGPVSTTYLLSLIAVTAKSHRPRRAPSRVTFWRAFFFLLALLW